MHPILVVTFVERLLFLNVQACCDIHNHFLWVAPTNKGSTHGSVAFTDSALYDLLMQMKDKLYDYKFFIIGDFYHASRNNIFR